MINVIIILLIFIWNCSGENDLTSQRELIFETIKKGPESGITEQKEEVLRSKEEWIDLWRRHTSIFSIPTEPPAVDFSQEMVIAIFMDERGSSGYFVEIKKIATDENSINVYYIESSPQGCSVTTNITEPFHIVKTRSSDLPLVFFKLVEVRNC